MTENLNRGAVFALGAAVCFATMGALIKLVSVNLPTTVVVFLRNGFALIILAPWIYTSGLNRIATSLFPIHIIRAFVGTASIYCYFYAIPHMQLANAVLLNYSQPLFIPFIAWFWLGERPPPTIWPIVVIGFLGVVLILKPDRGLVTPVAVVALTAGMLGAVAMVAVRRMAYTEPAIRIVLYFTAMGTLISAGPAFVSWNTPDTRALILMLAAALLGIAGQVMLTRAYALATAAQVGSLEYGAVVIAGIYGWVLWQEIPDIFSFLGAGLVGLAAILVVMVRTIRL